MNILSQSGMFLRCSSPSLRLGTLYSLRRSLASVAQQSSGEFNIPIIDFAKFRGNTDSRAVVSDEVVHAFKNVGFLYIKNHGIPEDTIATAFRESDEFFKLPAEVKSRLEWDNPRSNRGYVRQGREIVTNQTDPSVIAALRAATPDAKESMEIGNERHPLWKNKWPSTEVAPNFKSTMLAFRKKCHELHMDLLRAVALGLKLQETHFDTLANEEWHTLRLLNYPPIAREILAKEGQARAGAHTDYGSLTFVFQDQVGGLQVQNPHTQQYIPATPIPATVVVNVGDLLARWSNDMFRSTLHRVVSPTATSPGGSAEMTPKRQSIAFFCNPNEGTVIECLPNCVKEGEKPKYESVLTGEYLANRLGQTYS